MNIFYLDEDMEKCAKFHVNSHVVKQPLEAAQLLSTAHRILDTVYLSETLDKNLYKVSHQHHPSFKWVIQSKANYEFLYRLFEALLKEYTFRYYAKHATEALLEFLKEPPMCIPDKGFTKFTQVVPDDCRDDNPVVAYRNYYKKYKTHLIAYKRRDYPEWLL